MSGESLGNTLTKLKNSDRIFADGRVMKQLIRRNLVKCKKKEHEMKIVKNTIVASILVGISTGAAIADGKRISGGSYFGCTDKEYRGKLASAAAQEDMEAGD